MKTAVLVMSIISVLLMSFTLICGLWIKSQGDKIPDLASSINFHTMLALGTAIFTIITLVLAIIRF